jgi:hypothetical protein
MSLEDVPEWALRQLSIAEVIALQNIQPDAVQFTEWSHGCNKSYSIDIKVRNNDTTTLSRLGWETGIITTETNFFVVVSKWFQQ